MKIYIHVIDGVEGWMAVDAERLNDNIVLIEDFVEFDPDDTSFVTQFIPGDIVSLAIRGKGNDKYWAADQLVKPSDNKDKLYLEFLHRIATRDKPKNEEDRRKYSGAITRIRKEIRDGKFHYPAIVNYVNGIGT